jgi:Ca2+-binding EF-hand superfamily protein
VELHSLLRYYDVDGTEGQQLAYENFIDGLRDKLTERKRKVVDSAFAILDQEGSGRAQVSRIIDLFDASKNKDFHTGKKSRNEIILEFLNSFDSLQGKQEGSISKEEWV